MCRDMWSPRRRSWVKLKLLGRYILGRTDIITKFDYQEKPNNLKAFVDSDFAGLRAVP